MEINKKYNKSKNKLEKYIINLEQEMKKSKGYFVNSHEEAFENGKWKKDVIGYIDGDWIYSPLMEFHYDSIFKTLEEKKEVIKFLHKLSDKERELLDDIYSEMENIKYCWVIV